MSGSRIVRYDMSDVNSWDGAGPKSERYGRTEQGWTMLGFLWVRGLIKDGRIYYCPAQQLIVNYEQNWVPIVNGNSRIYISYSYRVAYDSTGNGMPPWNGQSLVVPYPQASADRADELNFVKGATAGKIKGTRAILADHFGYPDGSRAYWGHVKPYGICVAYTDGHCDYVPLSEKDWAVIRPGWDLSHNDQYMAMYYRAFDDGDYRKVRKAFGVN